MSNVTQDIVAKLWGLCNVLKDDGVTYHQYVNELTYLLFLKMADERPNLQVVADQIGRPTSCEDLAVMTLGLIDAGAKGTVHAANRGRCTWFEFAREIVALSGAHCRIDPCKASDQARPAARPRFSVLDLTEMIRLIGKPRHWKTALRDCIEAVAAASQAAQPGQTTAPSVEEH